MICALCGSNNLVKKGTITKDGDTFQRYKCKECSQYFKKIKIHGIDKRFINDEETSKEQVIKSIYEKAPNSVSMNLKDQTFFCLIKNTTLPFEIRVVALDAEHAANKVLRTFIDNHPEDIKKNLKDMIIHIFDVNHNKTTFSVTIKLSINYSLENLSNVNLRDY